MQGNRIGHPGIVAQPAADPPEHYDNDDSENHLSVGESGESLRSGYKNEYRLTYVCDVVTAPPATTSQAPAP
jgi:hypothetical protein